MIEARMIRIVATTVSVLLLNAPALAQTVQTRTHTLGKASGFVQLFVSVISPGQTLSFHRLNPDGSDGGTFTLPARMVFVLTDVQVERTATDGFYEGRICNSAGCNNDRVRFRFNSTQHPTFHLGLTAGIVFADTPAAFLFANSAGAAVVRLEGYLAKDK